MTVRYEQKYAFQSQVDPQRYFPSRREAIEFDLKAAKEIIGDGEYDFSEAINGAKDSPFIRACRFFTEYADERYWEIQIEKMNREPKDIPPESADTPVADDNEPIF